VASGRASACWSILCARPIRPRLAGISEVAYRRDVDLAVFAGGVLGAPRSDGINRNFVFDLCDKRSLDGAIILGGALGNFLGPSSVADLCARLAPLPLASIAIAPPGVPGLLVDEAPGMRQALEHWSSATAAGASFHPDHRQRRGRARYAIYRRAGARPRSTRTGVRGTFEVGR
jgi:hypothetical protein